MRISRNKWSTALLQLRVILNKSGHSMPAENENHFQTVSPYIWVPIGRPCLGAPIRSQPAPVPVSAPIARTAPRAGTRDNWQTG